MNAIKTAVAVTVAPVYLLGKIISRITEPLVELLPDISRPRQITMLDIEGLEARMMMAEIDLSEAEKRQAKLAAETRKWEALSKLING